MYRCTVQWSCSEIKIRPERFAWFKTWNRLFLSFFLLVSIFPRRQSKHRCRSRRHSTRCRLFYIYFCVFMMIVFSLVYVWLLCSLECSQKCTNWSQTVQTNNLCRSAVSAMCMSSCWVAIKINKTRVLLSHFMFVWRMQTFAVIARARAWVCINIHTQN